MRPSPRGGARLALIAPLTALLALVLPGLAQAQPCGSFLVLDNSNPGYVNVPHRP